MSGTDVKRVIRIGLDDTDHIDCACTTEHFQCLLTRLNNSIVSFETKERRLVRLWPFAPNRTRGNAALAAICSVNIVDLNNVDSICREFMDDLNKEIQRTYPVTGQKPSPCLLIALDDYPESWYWEAVRGEVSLKVRKKQIPDSTKIYSIEHNPNGIVGASSAIAWNPNEQNTWELIAWRSEDKIRSPREVSSQAIESMSENFPTTFANRDPTTGRGMIMPRTNCPVLYGIRAESSEELQSAHEFLQIREDVEKCYSWAIHRTNQISDDHLLGSEIGVVSSFPLEVQGGHSSVSVWTGSSSFTLVAFAESGEVNALLRRLNPGDEVEWMGLFSPSSEVHLERLRVNTCSPRVGKRPECCNKTMRSAGVGQGLRCKTCGNSIEKVWQTKLESFNSQYQGWVEPNPANRRHLAKPLQRGLPTAQNNQT